MYIMSMNVRTVVFTRNFTDHYSYHIHYKTLVKLKRIIDNVYIFHDKQHKKGLPCHVWSLLYFYVNMYFGTYIKSKIYFGIIWKNDRSQYKNSFRIQIVYCTYITSQDILYQVKYEFILALYMTNKLSAHYLNDNVAF